jgi:hypothetical protein
VTARLILHIGTEKTGSTAIQRFLSSQREWLSLQGYAVPRSLGAVEHRRFSLLFYQPDQQDDLTYAEGLDQRSAEEKEAATTHWIKEFDNEIAQAPNHSWIISSEHIHSRILHREMCMSKLSDFIKDRFQKILVIVYLREPLSAALSLWSTAVLNGAALADLPLPDNEYWNRLCCHRSTTDQLQRWFPGHFQPRLFTPERWINGDVIGDFCLATGIDLPMDYQAGPQRANPSLSWLSLSLIARLNREGRPSRDLVKAIRESFDHLPSPIANASQKRIYNKAYAASNEWVRNHYFAASPYLFPPSSKQE